MSELIKCTWIERDCGKRVDDICPHMPTRDNCEKRRKDLTKLFHNYQKAKEMHEHNPDNPMSKNQLNRARNELTLFLKHYKIAFTDERFHPLYGE
jgi:hypothetical protein